MRGYGRGAHAIRQGGGVGRGEVRAPGIVRAHGRCVTLRESAVRDADAERRPGREARDRSGQGDSGGGVGLSGIDDVVAVDRVDRDRRNGLLDRDGPGRRGRDIAVGVGHLRGDRRGADSVRQRDRVRRGDRRGPRIVGPHGRGIGLREGAVDDADIEGRPRRQTRDRARERDAARRMGLGGIDDIVSVDGVDGNGGDIPGDGDAVRGGGRDIAVGVGRLRRDRRRAVAERGGVARGYRGGPCAVGADRGRIGLGERAVRHGDVEGRARSETGRGSRDRDPGGGLCVIDDIVPIDRVDRDRGRGLLDRHRPGRRRRDIAVGVGHLGGDRRGADSVGQRDRVRRGDRRGPGIVGADGRGVSLGERAVDDADVEGRPRRQARDRSRQRDAAGNMGLGGVDDIVAVDGVDRDGGDVAGDGDAIGRDRRDVRVSVGRLSRDRGRSVGERVGVRRRDRGRPSAIGAHRRGVGLGERAVRHGDIEGRSRRQARGAAGHGHARRGLRVVDDIVAFDGADRDGRQGLLDGRRLRRGRGYVAVSVGRMGADHGRPDSVGHRDRIRRRDVRGPGPVGFDRGHIGLGEGAVDDADIEGRAHQETRGASRKRDPSCGFRMVDDVIAVDRVDGDDGRLLVDDHGLRGLRGGADRRRHRGGSVRQRRRVGGGDQGGPGGSARGDGGGVALVECAIDDLHRERRANGEPGHAAAQGHARRRLGGVDRIRALDRVQRHAGRRRRHDQQGAARAIALRLEPGAARETGQSVGVGRIVRVRERQGRSPARDLRRSDDDARDVDGVANGQIRQRARERGGLVEFQRRVGPVEGHGFRVRAAKLQGGAGADRQSAASGDRAAQVEEGSVHRNLAGVGRARVDKALAADGQSAGDGKARSDGEIHAGLGGECVVRAQRQGVDGGVVRERHRRRRAGRDRDRRIKVGPAVRPIGRDAPVGGTGGPVRRGRGRGGDDLQFDDARGIVVFEAREQVAADIDRRTVATDVEEVEAVEHARQMAGREGDQVEGLVRRGAEIVRGRVKRSALEGDPARGDDVAVMRGVRALQFQRDLAGLVLLEGAARDARVEIGVEISAVLDLSGGRERRLSG